MKRVGERKKRREKEKECLRERKEIENEREREGGGGRKQNGLAVPHNNSNAPMRETTFIEIIYPLYLILSNNI